MTLARISFASALLLATDAAALAADSAYSGLDEASCVLLQENAEMAWSLSECPAYAGYRVLLEDSDGRQSLSLVDPHGKPHDLDFANSVTEAFNTLGAKLEWRYERGPHGMSPYALIVRVNIMGDDDRPLSFLAVIRVGGEQTCVIERIEPQAEQNIKARAVADDRQRVSCRRR